MAVIDLSLPIYTGMNVHPGDPEVSVKIVHDYKGHGWQLRKLEMGSHTGTHVDGFSHMVENGETLDQIPLHHFFGKSWLAEQGQMLPNSTGLFFKKEAGLECLESLLKARPLFVGGEINEELQRALLEAGIVTYTNLINLELLPTNRPFMFYGFPLNILNGDGSPVRAIAILDEG